MFASSIDRKPHRVLLPSHLDEELVRPPPPPEDLPKPWVGQQWLRLYALAFILTVFGIWFLSRLFEIPFLDDFANSFTVTLGLFLFVGLYLINRFQLRGYYANYAARANKPLNKAIYRYRRRRASENLYQLFPRYMIGGEVYYLVWYVPYTSLRVTRPLKPGSEPLLFNHQGEWLDDERLFEKALMMWFYGVDMSPASLTLESGPARSYKGLRRAVLRYLPRLPGLLQANAKRFEGEGLEAELALVTSEYEAKCSLFRNSLELLLAKHLWGIAHGGDSLTQLRFEDMLRYHEADEAAIEARRRFVETHALEQAEAASLRMRRAVVGNGKQKGKWMHPKELDESLQAFAVPNPIGESYFRRTGGEWQGPEAALQAYRSRAAYARQLDAEVADRKLAAKGG